jgi:chromosome segregation ATPase
VKRVLVILMAAALITTTALAVVNGRQLEAKAAFAQQQTGQLNEQQAEIEDLRYQLSHLEGECEMELAKQQEMMEQDMAAQREQAEARYRGLETRFKLGQSENHTLQRRLEAANLNAQSLGGLLDQARDELSAQAELNQGLQHQLDKLMQDAPDRTQMKQRLEALDALLTRREEELAGQQALKSEQRERLETLEGLLTEREEELAGLQALYHEKQQQYDQAVAATRQTLESLTGEEKAHRETKDKLLMLQRQDEMSRGTISELRAQLNLMGEQMMEVQFQLQESERLRGELERELAGFQTASDSLSTAAPVATPSAAPLAAPSATPSATPLAAPSATPSATPLAAPLAAPLATPSAAPPQ